METPRNKAGMSDVRAFYTRLKYRVLISRTVDQSTVACLFAIFNAVFIIFRGETFPSMRKHETLGASFQESPLQCSEIILSCVFVFRSINCF